MAIGHLVIVAGLCYGGFVDVTVESGIRHRQFAQLPRNSMQAYMSGGAAAGDFDNDGWVDLYFTRLDGRDLLYRNVQGRFVDVTDEVFGPQHLADVQTNGVAWGDIDNDDDLDLYVTSLSSNRYHLFVNDGQGRFDEQAMERGASLSGDDLHFGFSSSFGDFDNDGYLDLHVTEWRQAFQNPNETPHNSRLLRNLGGANAGHFVDVTDDVGVAMDAVSPVNPGFDSQSFTSRFTDFDGDGTLDLAVASDHGTSRLFWNEGGRFVDGTRAAGVGTDQYGMGSAVGDIDNDGDLDWFVTSIFESDTPNRDGNRLYLNAGDRTFEDVTDAVGVRDGGWGWGAAMFDFDHDGDLDIAQASGQFFPFATHISEGYAADTMRMFRNRGDGSFDETADELGLADLGSGKGLLTLDYDNDGDLDLLVVNNGDLPVLYQNQVAQERGWLQIDPRGAASNAQGVGARIIVDPDLDVVGDEQLREIDAGNHFLGQSPSIAHFGFDRDVGQIDRVTVAWPSGARQSLFDVAVNQRLEVVEFVPEPNSLSMLLMGGWWTARLLRRHRRVSTTAFD